MKRISYHERREKVRRVLEEYGRTNINLTTMAKEFGVSPQMILKDIDALAKEGMDIKPKRLKYNADLTIAKLRKECDRIISNPSTQQRTKLQALKLLLEATKEETEFAEKYGVKEKIPDKIESVGINIGLTAEQMQEWYEKWKMKQLNI